MEAIRGHFQRGTDPYFFILLSTSHISSFMLKHKMHDSSQNCYISATLHPCNLAYKTIQQLNLNLIVFIIESPHEDGLNK